MISRDRIVPTASAMPEPGKPVITLHDHQSWLFSAVGKISDLANLADEIGDTIYGNPHTKSVDPNTVEEMPSSIEGRISAAQENMSAQLDALNCALLRVKGFIDSPLMGTAPPKPQEAR